MKKVFLITLIAVLTGGLVPPVRAANIGVYEFDPNQFEQVIAVSDVHGMYSKLVVLLQNAKLIDEHKNWIGGRTLLIITGDSIDKGKESIPVVDLWIQLRKQARVSGGAVAVLLGNHEAEFLASEKHPKHNEKADAFLDEIKDSGGNIRDWYNPNNKYGAYMRSLPLAAKVGRWVFSHAGMVPNMPWNQFKAQAIQVLLAGNYDHPLLSDENSILQAKEWWKKRKDRNDYQKELYKNGYSGVVFGHQPRAFDLDPGIYATTDDAVNDQGHQVYFVRIDSGMPPVSGGKDGQMLLFRNPAELNQPDKMPKMEVLHKRKSATPIEVKNL